LKTINQFKEKDKVEIPLLISQVTQGVTTSGAPYLSVVCQDKTGSIDGKLWDVKEEQNAIIKPGMIIDVVGEVLKYRNSLQLRIHSVFKPHDDYQIADFVEQTSVPIEDLKQRVDETIVSIEDEVIKGIIQEVFNRYEKEFFEFPAASKNHHDFLGGLATHVVSMLDVGEFLIKQYPLLNRDLLLGGILLHDIGKILELSGPILTEYTLKGRLLGHISMVNAIIFEVAKTKGWEDKEQTVLLSHLVLAHHGQLEYGSPVLPMVPEAEILNLIDNLDARMNMFEKMIEVTEPKTFSARIFSLENRNFYRSK
jgi:3'-5' exoribonuclease